MSNRLSALAFLTVVLVPVSAVSQTKLLRYPDIAGDRVAFCYAGDIKVALLNETSASDGDLFPHVFRKAGLGPLVGKRSWGGVVGSSGLGPMIDGGQITVPLSGTNDVDPVKTK